MAKRHKDQRGPGEPPHPRKAPMDSPATKPSGKKDRADLKMAEPEELTAPQTEERFDKAFALSLGLIALLSLLIFIPLIGPLLGLTLVPYLACDRGCRYVKSRNGIHVGFMVGIVWSSIELYILFQALESIKVSLGDPGIFTVTDMAVIVTIYVATTIFCIIGGYTGGSKFGMVKAKKGKVEKGETKDIKQKK